jgi:hypothetical protein
LRCDRSLSYFEQRCFLKIIDICVFQQATLSIPCFATGSRQARGSNDARDFQARLKAFAGAIVSSSRHRYSVDGASTISISL